LRYQRLRNGLSTIRQVLRTTDEPRRREVPSRLQRVAGVAALSAVAVALLLLIEVTAWKALQPEPDMTSAEQIETALADVTAALFSAEGELARVVSAEAALLREATRALNATPHRESRRPMPRKCSALRTMADPVTRNRDPPEQEMEVMDHNTPDATAPTREIGYDERKKRITLSLIAAMTLLLARPAPVDAGAQGPPRGRGPRPEWEHGLMLGVPLHTLNLTPEQQTQVKSILSTYRTSARPILQQLRQVQGGLGDKLLAPGQLQAADMQPQVQQISQLRGQLLQLSAQATLDVRGLLTPEQLAAAAQTKAKMKDLRRDTQLCPATHPDLCGRRDRAITSPGSSRAPVVDGTE
jgi:Spy/CpxP family protein refolding chaperone